MQLSALFKLKPLSIQLTTASYQSVKVLRLYELTQKLQVVELLLLVTRRLSFSLV
jgi:hypothetical protein